MVIPPRSACVFHRSHLAQHGDLDFTGEGHFLADAFGDVARDVVAVGVVDRIGVDDHADLAAGLDGEGVGDALHAGGDFLELLESLDIFLQRLATGAGAGRRNRVGGHDDGRVNGRGGDVVVVSADGVEHGFVLLAVPGAEVHADGRVPAFDLVVHRLADVVQETAASGPLAVQPELIGDHLTQVGDLHRMTQHVLPEARAEVQLAHRLHDLGMILLIPETSQAARYLSAWIFFSPSGV